MGEDSLRGIHEKGLHDRGLIESGLLEPALTETVLKDQTLVATSLREASPDATFPMMEASFQWDNTHATLSH